MVASEHDARNLIDRYKEEVMAEVTAGYMKEMAAMVLGFGLPGTRRAAMEKLEKEAREAWENDMNPELGDVTALPPGEGGRDVVA